MTIENVKNIFDVLIKSTYYENKNNLKNISSEKESQKDIINSKSSLNIFSIFKSSKTEKTQKERDTKDNLKEIKKLESLNKTLNDKIKNLENELKEEKKNNKILKQNIEDLIKNNNKNLKEKEKIINDKEKKYQELNKKIKELEKICNKNTNFKKVLDIMEEIKEKEQIITELKKKLPFELSKKEKLITLNFISSDENIISSIICKNTHKFNIVANLFYDKFPEYKKHKIQFIFKGKEIDENQPLEDINIKDNSLITIQYN